MLITTTVIRSVSAMANPNRRKAKLKRHFRRVAPDISSVMQEKYRKLNHKYLTDAENLLLKEDYVQASEKFWGAFAEVVKGIAAQRGLLTRSHLGIGEIVDLLQKEFRNVNLTEAYFAANSLHSNFYEEELTPEQVKKAASIVKDAINVLGSAT